MSTSSAVTFRQDQKLQGKLNFIDWTHRFERAAKAKDVLKLLKGDEENIDKRPEFKDFLVDTNGKDMTSLKHHILADNTWNLLAWQAEVAEWEQSKKKKVEAWKLLFDSVCESIAIGLDDFDAPVAAYKHIMARYKHSNALARKQTLQKISTLKLQTCQSMTEFINRHHQYRKDLSSAGFLYTDAYIVSNLLQGLPAKYHEFKERIEWFQAKDGEKDHYLTFFAGRLLEEEINLQH